MKKFVSATLFAAIMAVSVGCSSEPAKKPDAGGAPPRQPPPEQKNK